MLHFISEDITVKGAKILMIKVNLSRIMGEKKINMTELAEMAGIAKNTVRGLYHETARGISWDVLEKLCKALHCQPGDLIEYRDDDE
jgi:putative transcriptional regulator